LGTIVDYLDYLKIHQDKKAIQKILVMVEHIHPKIESMINEEIAKLTEFRYPESYINSEEETKSLFDLTIISSLSFILSQYLVSLSKRTNQLNVTENNLDKFITNLIKGMIKPVKSRK
jgi:GTP:adenosylcobinamide-phosphate guanylyltransferase